MRRATLFLLLFVPALFLGDRAFAYIAGRLVSKSRDRYVEAYEGRATADILVIGNSRADNHFPPQMMSDTLHRRVVNLGLGGISAVLAEAVVADFVEKNGAPAQLVIEPSCLLVEPSEVGDMRMFATYSERLSHLVARYMPEFHHAARVFHLFHYNNEMFIRVLHQIRSAPRDRLHFTTVTPELLEVLRSRGAYDLLNHAENEAAFARLLVHARVHGIRVQVVITPYLPVQIGKIRNFTQWKERLVSELGVKREELFDYSSRFERADYFRDGVHMNTAGTKELLRTMITEGFYQPD